MEAASYGAQKIKTEQEDEASIGCVGKPGKYSRKYETKERKKAKCRNYSNKAYKGGTKCYAYQLECFECGKKGHFRGAAVCKGKTNASKTDGKKMRSKSERKNLRRLEDDTDDSSSSGEGGTASEALGISTFNGKEEGIVNSVASERNTKTQKWVSQYPYVF